jgi:hypothetical protein
MWSHVVLVWTDVSEEHIASIFRVEKSEARNQREQVAADCTQLLTLVPRSQIFLPWRWRRYIHPKRRFTQDLHGATSQKTAFFRHVHAYGFSGISMDRHNLKSTVFLLSKGETPSTFKELHCNYFNSSISQGSSDTLGIGYEQGSIPEGMTIFLFAITPSPTLNSIQPNIHWV